MIYDITGNKLINDVYYFEDYNDSIKKILTIIGKSYLIPRIDKTNCSLHNDYKEYYDPELIDIVGKYFKIDIETFGYKFDGRY